MPGKNQQVNYMAPALIKLLIIILPPCPIYLEF